MKTHNQKNRKKSKHRPKNNHGFQLYNQNKSHFYAVSVRSLTMREHTTFFTLVHRVVFSEIVKVAICAIFITKIMKIDAYFDFCQDFKKLFFPKNIKKYRPLAMESSKHEID